MSCGYPLCHCDNSLVCEAGRALLSQGDVAQEAPDYGGINAERRKRLAAPFMPPDPVNHPPHYTSGKIECIDAIEAALTPEEFRGYCKGQVFKYNWRAGLKDDALQDTQKAEWYLKRLLATLAK